MTIHDRIQTVNERIQRACELTGRQASDVQTIAVTKYVSTKAAAEAVNAGLKHIGENRWQTAKEKWDYFQQKSQEELTWHFIGSLQTNKVKDVIGKFHYIHSLDRLSLAQAIHKQAEKLNIFVKCFIQVNVSGETSKQGISPEEVKPFLAELQQYPNIIPVGLMTMAPYESEPEATRPVFRALRELRDELHSEFHTVKELSMGMSNDFDVAIEEGATFIRLGSILLGKEEE